MSENIGGRVEVSADGKNFIVGESAAFNPGGYEITSKMSRDGRHFHTESPIPSMVEFESYTVEGGDPRDLVGLRDATVVVKSGNVTWAINGAVYAGPTDQDLINGTFTIKFVGPPANRV